MQGFCTLTTGFDKIIRRINKQNIQETIKRKDRATNYDKYRNGNRSLTKIVQSIRYKRFQKHKNLVQTNRSHVIQTANSRVKTKEFSIGSKVNLLPRKKTLELEPKTKDQFFSNFSGKVEGMRPVTSQNLQHILMKNKFKNQRNLLGYNILRLEQKYHFSRFELHNLYSMYHTLLRDSKGDIKRFKSGFEVILNMIKIAIRPEILESIFVEQQKLDFQNFIEMYSKIDQAIFRQTIIDYVEILFEGIYDKQRIRYDDIIRIMKNRITQKQSEDIAKIIYEQIDRRIDLTVSIAEIYALCNNCQTFAQKMFRLYSGQARQ